MDKSIIVENVSKKYKLYSKSSDRIKDIIFPKEYGKTSTPCAMSALQLKKAM